MMTTRDFELIEKAKTERYKQLVKAAKKFANETFSDNKDMMKLIVEYKRMMRLALRGDLI